MNYTEHGDFEHVFQTIYLISPTLCLFVLFNSITVHYTISPLYYRVRGSSKTGAYLLVVSGWCTC